MNKVRILNTGNKARRIPAKVTTEYYFVSNNQSSPVNKEA